MSLLASLWKKTNNGFRRIFQDMLGMMQGTIGNIVKNYRLIQITMRIEIVCHLDFSRLILRFHARQNVDLFEVFALGVFAFQM